MHSATNFETAPEFLPSLEMLPTYISTCSSQAATSKHNPVKVTSNNFEQQSRALEFIIEWVASKFAGKWSPGMWEHFETKVDAVADHLVGLELTTQAPEQQAMWRLHSLKYRQKGRSRDAISRSQARGLQSSIEALKQHYKGRVFDELSDTLAHAKTILAGLESLKPRPVIPEAIQDETWDWVARLKMTDDRLGIYDCNNGKGARTGSSVYDWHDAAAFNGKQWEEVSRPACGSSQAKPEKSKKQKVADPKTTVLVDMSEDPDGNIPTLLVTAPVDY